MITDKPFPVCQRCDCSEFTIIGKIDYTVSFSYGEKGLEVSDRSFGDTKSFERIYCAECGRIVGNRSKWESIGLHVPI